MNRSIADDKADSAIIYFFQADQLATPGFPDEVISLNLTISSFFQQKGVYLQAIKCKEKALQYFRVVEGRDTVSRNHFFCMSDIGGLFLRISRFDSAYAYYAMAFAAAEKKQEAFLKVHAENNIAYWYGARSELSKAYVHYRKALSNFGPVILPGDSSLFGVINGNISLLLFQQKKYSEAIPYLEVNLETSRRGRMYYDYLGAILLYAEINIIKGNYSSALSQLKEAELLARRENLLSDLPNCYLLYADAYLKQGNTGEGRKYLEAYKQIRKELDSKSLLDLRHTNEILGQQQVELLEAELKSQMKAAGESQKLLRSRQQILVLVILLLLLLAAVIFLIYRRKNSEMQKRSEIEKIQKNLLAQELLNEELVKKQLDQELRSTKKDLTTLAIDIHQQDKLKNDIISRLKQIQYTDSNDQIRKGITELVTELNQKLVMDKEKLVFKEHVEELNNSFFEKLALRFPNLTKNEREFCGLMRLNLSTKEIAVIKNITVESTKMLKHRVRKKLEMEAGEDMYEFIMGV